MEVHVAAEIPRQLPHDRCVWRSFTGIPVLLDTLEPGDDRLPHDRQTTPPALVIQCFHRLRGVPMSAPSFELVRLRAPEGLILYFKDLAGPWTFRLMPIRDPDQPRLWCLRMEPCAGASLTAKTAMVDPFYTSLAMSRDQLGQTLDAIHENLMAWLDQPDQASVRAWLLAMVARPLPADFMPPEPPARAAKAAADTVGPTPGT